MVPSEGELHSHLHITPMRGTRALALRFLANKFGLDMSDFTVRSLFWVAARGCCFEKTSSHVCTAVSHHTVPVSRREVTSSHQSSQMANCRGPKGGAL